LKSALSEQASTHAHKHFILLGLLQLYLIISIMAQSFKKRRDCYLNARYQPPSNNNRIHCLAI